MTALEDLAKYVHTIAITKSCKYTDVVWELILSLVSITTQFQLEKNKTLFSEPLYLIVPHKQANIISRLSKLGNKLLTIKYVTSVSQVYKYTWCYM